MRSRTLRTTRMPNFYRGVRMGTNTFITANHYQLSFVPHPLRGDINPLSVITSPRGFKSLKGGVDMPKEHKFAITWRLLLRFLCEQHLVVFHFWFLSYLFEGSLCRPSAGNDVLGRFPGTRQPNHHVEAEFKETLFLFTSRRATK